MFVRNKMTLNPYTISYDDRLPAAKRLMEAKHIKHLPVMKNGRLVGIITGADIAKAMPSVATTLSASEIPYLLDKIRIADIMGRDPVTVAPDELLEEAAKKMRDTGVSFLPVMEQNSLVGVISDGDIFDAFIELQGAREPGWRLVFETEDNHGVLARIAAFVEQAGGNITSSAVYRHQDPHKRYIILGVSETDVDALCRQLEEAGLPVLYKTQNQ